MRRKTDIRAGRTKKPHLSAILFIFLALPAWGASGANVFVPVFDLTSWVSMKAEIQTRADFGLTFDGGNKYQAEVAFKYYNLAVETNPTPAVVFDGVKASVRDVLRFLDITYFTGFYGILGEGIHYKGHLYHRGGFEYEGYYPVVGTGLLFTGRITGRMAAGLSVYQGAGSGYINSMDLTYSAGSDSMGFQLFTGVSDQVYRAGTMLTFSGNEIELSLTVGTLTIEEGRSITFDDFYFLAEEWFKMNRWDLWLSVFTRPRVHYDYPSRQYADTGEMNDIDFNFDLSNTSKKGTFTTGGEFNIRTDSLDDLGVSFSPYISIFSSGLTWKIKVDLNLLSQSRDLFSAYLNLQSSF